MTIAEAWRRLRRDPQWKKKLATAGAVNLIPYVGPFITIGYALNYARAVAWDVDGGRLPEWSAFGEHGRRGLYAFVVSFVYGLPLTAVMLALLVPLFAVMPTAAEARGVPPASVLVATIAYSAVIGAVSLAYLPISYSGMLEYLMFDRLEAAWRFRDVFARVRQNVRPLSALVLRSIALSLGLAAVSIGFVGGVVAVILLPVLGHHALSPVVFAVIPIAYMLFFALIAAASGIVNLVVYSMLGAYARTAYQLPVRAA